MAAWYPINPASTWKTLFHHSSFYFNNVICILLRGKSPGRNVRGDCPRPNYSRSWEISMWDNWERIKQYPDYVEHNDIKRVASRLSEWVKHNDIKRIASRLSGWVGLLYTPWKHFELEATTRCKYSEPSGAIQPFAYAFSHHRSRIILSQK